MSATEDSPEKPTSAEQPQVLAPSHELDAVRRHVCHVLGFDYGLIDVISGDEQINLMRFSGQEGDNKLAYPVESLEDENKESLVQPNSKIAAEVARTMQPYVGNCRPKRNLGEAEPVRLFPYFVVPLLEELDEGKYYVRGLLRLVAFNPGSESESNTLQTLKIVGQHLATRLPDLALQVLESNKRQEFLGALDVKLVLLVHENRVIRRRFSRCLSSAYRVLETDDPAKCLELAALNPVDVVVISGDMKDQAGELLHKSVKRSMESRVIPLILVTASEDPNACVNGLNAGADDCIDEQCVEAELLARVRTMIRIKKTEREMSTQLDLLEDYAQRLEQLSEKEKKANSRIASDYEHLDKLTRDLREEKQKTEIRRAQDNLLHRISDILRKSFSVEENIAEMLENLAGYFQLDCCFVVLPSPDEPQDTIRLEYCSDPSYSLLDQERDLQILDLFSNKFGLQEDLFVSDVKRDRKAEPFRKEVLANYHMYSLFYLPITYEEKLQGILGGHRCESEKIWSLENDQNFLRQVADQLATALTNSRLYKRVERQATIDGLTGLFNHRTGQEKLSEQLRVAERYKRNLCVVMMDVDHFKSINDNHGHPVGDTVLRSVAHVIRRDCRDVDIPIRYGGEEFLLVLPEVNLEGASVVAERLRKTLSREIIYHDSVKLNVTASIGIACFPDDADNQQQLLELADKALYMSKRMGRNQVHSAAELNFSEYRKNAALPPADQAVINQDTVASDLSASQPEISAPSPDPVVRGVVSESLKAPETPVEDNSPLVPEVVDTVRKMAGALYAKSEYNKVHHLETARFAEMVAKVLNLSQKQVEQIRVASLLHDVGLLHVPDDILNKSEQITAEELKVLMQHPTLGAEMLRSIPALHEICDILESHHECWDGTGYPRGLRGEEIPIAARIVSIVDAYHAMISDRPYRQAMAPEKAKSVLKESSGSQFDPYFVDIFLTVLKEIEERQI
ncbi:MAG: diguanylate cyclase [Candidatus Obscuribacterales bacterium]|nr:diguanylate cyclase [Candidatus Obscuribacterales bacterium]